MKRITTILASVLLCTSLAQAKDKDYSVDVKTKNLKIGKNDISVFIKSKTTPVSNAKVKLTVYHPDNTVNIYKTTGIFKNNNKYTFSVDLPQKGKYTYLVKFNRMGGVSHTRRGNWQL